MGPFGAGIRWEVGRLGKKTILSQRAQGTQGKHEGLFLLHLCDLCAAFELSAFWRFNYGLVAPLWQLFEVGQILVSSCRSFVDFEVFQADQADINTVQLIVDPSGVCILEVHSGN